MNTLDMLHAIEAWVSDSCPGVNNYDHPPEELAMAMPLVVAEVATDETRSTDTQLPGVGAYQQTNIRVWTVDIIIMVQPDPPDEASHTLYGYLDTLQDKLMEWVRLEENVVLSQFYSASYDPPEVEFADGTKARQVTVRVTVGETIGA